MMKVTFYLFDFNDILILLLFGNILLMLVLYDKLKTPHIRINILSQMKKKECQYPQQKNEAFGRELESSGDTDNEGMCFCV